MIKIIVMKYINHDPGVKRFFRFHNIVVFCGYREKKYAGKYIIEGAQKATLLLPYVQAKTVTAKSA